MVKDQGVGFIVKIPLDSGWLSGKYGATSTFTGSRSRWSAEEIQKRSELVEIVSRILGEEVSMVQAALQFILSYAEVSTIIPGIRSIEQLNQNIQASEGGLPPHIRNQLVNLLEK